MQGRKSWRHRISVEPRRGLDLILLIDLFDHTNCQLPKALIDLERNQARPALRAVR